MSKNAVHVLGVPDDYPPPIRNVLASLHAGLPVSDGRAEIFSLACAITALQPTNGISPSTPRPEESDVAAEPSDYDSDLSERRP